MVTEARGSTELLRFKGYVKQSLENLKKRWWCRCRLSGSWRRISFDINAGYVSSKYIRLLFIKALGSRLTSNITHRKAGVAFHVFKYHWILGLGKCVGNLPTISALCTFASFKGQGYDQTCSHIIRFLKSFRIKIVWLTSAIFVQLVRKPCTLSRFQTHRRKTMSFIITTRISLRLWRRFKMTVFCVE